MIKTNIKELFGRIFAWLKPSKNNSKIEIKRKKKKLGNELHWELASSAESRWQRCPSCQELR